MQDITIDISPAPGWVLGILGGLIMGIVANRLDKYVADRTTLPVVIQLIEIASYLVAFFVFCIFVTTPFVRPLQTLLPVGFWGNLLVFVASGLAAAMSLRKLFTPITLLFILTLSFTLFVLYSGLFGSPLSVRQLHALIAVCTGYAILAAALGLVIWRTLEWLWSILQKNNS